ncbi:MAG: sigma-70 family RNA polymerase sigma factor [Cyclobacteriaceae bacterium]|nr:sigma-70 family RNA polymerase sigma factor [Cyclobacteriaceae bacterium]
MQTDQKSVHTYLIVKSQEGDRRAQNELFKLYANAMYNICRRMMGNEEEAQKDCAFRHAFVDAFTKIGDLRQPEMFTAWLKRIVINHNINALNKNRLLTKDIEEQGDFAEKEDHGISETLQYEVKKVLSAIDRISEGCRTVLNLYLFEGYDHKEIAQILNISESASKAQYSKARAKVRQIIFVAENTRLMSKRSERIYWTKPQSCFKLSRP